MPVTMADSVESESESEQTESSTEVLPNIPIVEDMNTWDEKKVLQWIQQRIPDMLKDKNLDTFNKAGFDAGFLDSNVGFFHSCGLPPGISRALQALANEVNKSKFIPWTNEIDRRRKRSYSSDRQRDSRYRSRDRSRDRYDYDDSVYSMDVTRTPVNNVKGRLSNQIYRRRKRSYSPGRQRDPRDRSQDRYDYDDSKFIPWTVTGHHLHHVITQVP